MYTCLLSTLLMYWCFQAHLLGIFDNVKSVVFHEKEYDRILAISSRECETIQLESAVLAQGNVEMWLGQLLQQAMDSLHGVIRDASVAIASPSFELLGRQLTGERICK